ncbi:MAG: hypothetical protein KDE27_31585, partial [Planctomycetes bacterium]|nr:hypothetical protein [Planctomycetota bacterium]
MNHQTFLIPGALATALLGSPLAAQQSPLDGPPWWAVQDDETVSLFWNFSGPAPLVPQQIATPSWYNPNVTQMVPTGPLQVIPSLGGHTDVYGIVGNGSPQQAQISLTVDNDPHLNWVKIFLVQFDAFEGSVGSIVDDLDQQLSQYERSSMTWKSVPIGNGWETVTIDAELWPQPADEDFSWNLSTNFNDNVAIDNLFVNSRCVKVEDADADGDALGAVDTATFGPLGLDLTAATGRTCVAAGMTENATTFLRSYWISALAPTVANQHQIIRFINGTPVAGTTLPDTPGTAPFGASDLAIETIRLSTGQHQQFVHLVVDRRGTPGNNVVIRTIDPTTGQLVASFLSVTLPGTTPEPLGLAFNPDGDTGNGTFLIVDQLGNGFEVERVNGSVIRTFPGQFPPRSAGVGYDAVFGKHYFFSSLPETTPAGTLRVNGHEYSAYDSRPTGTRFWGNLQVPNAGGVQGGVAAGLEVYRLLRPIQRGEMRLLSVVQTATGSVVYELFGPWKFGRSRHGVTRMAGQPFENSTNFQLTLDGLRPATASFAVLY